MAKWAARLTNCPHRAVNQILALAQESAANQTSGGKQPLGLARWRTGDFSTGFALLWPWARNGAHLNLIAVAVIDVVSLWRGCLLHVAHPFSQHRRCDLVPGASRGVPVFGPLTG